LVFSSITFLFYFLPLVLFSYYLVPYKLKNFILLIFSLIFYAYGEPIYIFIMLFSCVVDYINALIIDKYRNTYKAKLALIFSIIINLSLLAFFKYSDFFISIVNSLTNYNIPLLNITLPIGISFYTFQTMSYTIDVYRNEAPIQKNIFSLSTFVTLFPQLVAGPIVRYSDVSYDLNHRIHNFDKFYNGVYRFIIGLCKKVILANNLGVIWYSIKATPYDTLSLATSWLGIICFTLQIYFDFSGYSDMAIGLGKIFGFDFLENFNFPYISKSITEFWRRWHISLGVWFRDYVYIPLGGNRCSKSRWFLNIFIVWFLTGLWHGASFNFILWGLYFGVVLIFEKLFLLEFLGLEFLDDLVEFLTLVLVSVDSSSNSLISGLCLLDFLVDDFVFLDSFLDSLILVVGLTSSLEFSISSCFLDFFLDPLVLGLFLLAFLLDFLFFNFSLLEFKSSEFKLVVFELLTVKVVSSKVVLLTIWL